jgi:hypothetical protein
MSAAIKLTRRALVSTRPLEDFCMRLKIVLMTATALSLTMAAARANDSNTLYIEQDGAGNTASVTQSVGLGNNNIGTALDPVTQDGDGNSFTFTNASNYYGGNNDVIDVEQVGNQNIFNNWVWNNGSDNVIDDVEQTGNLNRVSITMNGSDSGLVDDVLQQGNANHMLIEQYGNSAGNQVQSAKQIGNNNGLPPDGNGDYRRVGTLIRQTGAGSNVVVSSYIEGSDNIGPAGDSNTYRNTHRIEQNGYSNEASASTLGSRIGSDYNRIWIFQTGDENTSTVSQGISTASTGNRAEVVQNGDYNIANATQFGSGNVLDATQTGDGNEIQVNITGDLNGGGLFGGAAATLASGSGILSGEITQTGLDNVASYDVVNSNGNQFAFLQAGNDNTIDGDVSGGGSNSAVVVQSGNNNGATFSQSGGGGNILAVSQ